MTDMGATVFHITTLSGRKIDFLQPNANEVHPLDLAVSLSREGRFANQTAVPYSVAQHSVVVHDITLLLWPQAGRNQQLYSLLHDAHEAYMRDLPTPFANALELLAPGALTRLKKRVQGAINLAFQVDPSYVEEARVHAADRIALRCERLDLSYDLGSHWPVVDAEVRPEGLARIEPLGAEAAMSLWLARLEQVCRLEAH